jgi:hypothetical protein
MNSQIINYTSRNHGLVTGGAHGLGNHSGQSSGRPEHHSGETPPRSRGPASYHQNSSSLKGWTPPREKLCLARGRPELVAHQVPNLGIPRAELRLDPGLYTPSGGSLPRSRAMRTLGWISASLGGLVGPLSPHPLPRPEH